MALFRKWVLAPRILHFAKNEVVFEGKAGCKCECTNIGLRGEAFIKTYYQELFDGKFYVNSWVGWRNAVANYSKNRLTDSHDVLPALAGISSRLQCRIWKFLGGLREKALVHGVFWYTIVSAPISDPLYTAPSFSWASLIRRAKFEDLHWTDIIYGSSDIHEPGFKILSATCSIKGSNAYGWFSEGYVKLEAECFPIAILGHHLRKDYPCLRVRVHPIDSRKENIAPEESSARVYLDCGKINVENMTHIYYCMAWLRGSSRIPNDNDWLVIGKNIYWPCVSACWICRRTAPA